MTQTHLDYNNQIRSQLTMLERLQTILATIFIVACLVRNTMLYGVTGQLGPVGIRTCSDLIDVAAGILMALVTRVWFRLAYPIFLVDCSTAFGAIFWYGV